MLNRYLMFLWLIVSGAGGLLAPRAFGELPGELETAQKAYQQKVADIRSEHERVMGTLRERYAQALDQLAEEVRQDGDLEQYLAVQEEQEKVTRGEEPGPLDQNAGASFSSLRDRYDQAAAQLLADRDEKIREIGNTYRNFLETVQKQLVRENRIDEALQVRTEVEKLQASLPEEPEQKMFDPFASAPPTQLRQTLPAVYLNWNPRSAPGLIQWNTDAGKRKLAFTHPDTFSLTPAGIATDGRSKTEFGKEAAEAFSKAVAAADEFSLVIEVMTEALDQKGPARILTFSRGTGLRNFTLGQQNDWLVMRLRTSETGRNGMPPELGLTQLTAGEALSLVFTYHPDTGARFFCQGKEVDLPPVRGNLRNWEPYTFVLGNETSGDRPWKGRVGFFELHARALDSDQARKRSAGR